MAGSGFLQLVCVTQSRCWLDHDGGGRGGVISPSNGTQFISGNVLPIQEQSYASEERGLKTMVQGVLRAKALFR